MILLLLFQVLKRIPSTLNMNLVVPEDYIEGLSPEDSSPDHPPVAFLHIFL